jgi:hypothetical protein
MYNPAKERGTNLQGNGTKQGICDADKHVGLQLLEDGGHQGWGQVA